MNARAATDVRGTVNYRAVGVIVAMGIAIALLLTPAVFEALFALGPLAREERMALWCAAAMVGLISALLWRLRPERTALVFLAGLLMVAIELSARAVVNHIAPSLRERMVQHALVVEPSQWKFRAHPFLQYVGNQHYTPSYSGQPTFNALGFRGEERPRQKPVGTIRIVCLGGSTTEDGYPELMEAYLNERAGQNGVRFEVLNFGLAGYTSAHSLISFVLDAVDFGPDYAVFDQGWNDKAVPATGTFTSPTFRSDYSNTHKEFSLPPIWDAPLIRASVIYRELRTLTHPYDAWTSFSQAIYRLRPVEALNNPRYQGPSNIETFWRNAQTVIDVARARGIQPVVVTQPRANDPRIHRFDEGWFIDATNAIVREKAANRSDVVFVDVAARMGGDRPIFTDLGHLTWDGRREKATLIGEAILAHRADKAAQ
jgi:hypothetical protein